MCVNPFPTGTPTCPSLSKVLAEDDEVWMMTVENPSQPSESEETVISPRHFRTEDPAIEWSIPQNSRL